MLGAIFVSACDSSARSEPTRELMAIKEAACDCDAVSAKVPSVLFAYDPGYFAFAATIRPKVHDSCIEDAWPEPLRRCIVTAKPDALAHDHACEYLVSFELAEKISKRFGIPVDSLPHAAQSPTTIAP